MNVDRFKKIWGKVKSVFYIIFLIILVLIIIFLLKSNDNIFSIAAQGQAKEKIDAAVKKFNTTEGIKLEDAINRYRRTRKFRNK